MGFLNTIWTWIVAGLTSLWKKEGPALAAWLAQFRTDIGAIILQETAVYGPQILAGTISITDAKDKVIADLTAKGISEAASLAETVFNALRTQTNLAATAAAPAVA